MTTSEPAPPSSAVASDAGAFPPVGDVVTPHEAKWRWWERWTLVVDFPLGQWRVAPRGWFTRGTATIQAAMGEMHSLVYPAGHRGHVTVVRTRDVLKGDASADPGAS